MITINQQSKIVTSACIETFDNGIQKIIINLFSKEYELLSSGSHYPQNDKIFEFGTEDYENISTVIISGINSKSIRYDLRCKEQLIFLYLPFELVNNPIDSHYVRNE